MEKPNIILIGMPGAGKSTVGVLLAKMLSFDFLDTDVLIQSREAARLQYIINAHGLDSFRAIEEKHICSAAPEQTVIATGGSAVYSNRAMVHLKKTGTAVFLDIPLEDLNRRIHNMDSRGVVINPGQTFADLFEERLPLYRKYADITIRSASLNHEQTAQAVIDSLGI